MKLLYLFWPFFIPFVLQNTGDAIEQTAELLKNDNIEELSKNFASSVDLSIMGDENTYPDSQAKTVLINFFDQNRPETVRILHRITSNAEYHYAVVILKTNHKLYRTSFSLKNIKGKFELTELRIETEKTE